MISADSETAGRTGTTSSAPAATTREERFDWPLCHDAENFLLDQIQAFLARNAFASRLSERMRFETGTLLIDWVDYLLLSSHSEPALRRSGFAGAPLGETPGASQQTLWHPEAMLP